MTEVTSGVLQQTEGSAEASEHSAGRITASRDYTRWYWSPWFLASILGVFCLPMQSTVPQPGLDPSWKLGLSLAHVDGIHAGSTLVFTYGPLGFLAEPNIVWTPGALLGLSFALLVAFGLSLVVNYCLRDWLSAPWALVLTIALALIAARIADVPELAATALVLWSLRLVRPERLAAALPASVPAALGAIASLLLLVKTSTGVVALSVAALVAIARQPRWCNLVLTLTSASLALAGWWLLAGQPLSSLGDWLRYSVEEAGGYSAAMAATAAPHSWAYWFLFATALALASLALRDLVRNHGARALPFCALFFASAWFVMKEGFVRLEQWHLPIAFLGLALLMTAVPFTARRVRLGAAGISCTLLVALVASAGSVASLPQEMNTVASAPEAGLTEAVRVFRSSVQPSYKSSQLSAARRSIARFYQIPSGVLEALGRGGVHADPWDISALWAYGLRWEPLPVLQTYDAYTSGLDDLDADRALGVNAPAGVLRSVTAIDFRFPAWESPATMVALTCDYAGVAVAGRWEALRRVRPGCDQPRFLARREVAPGATLHVPKARHDGDLVVASFEYPSSMVERLLTFVVKPPLEPAVVVNGQGYRLVTATAAQLHLLRVPTRIAHRFVTNGGLAVDTLAFPNAPGTVTVTYYDLPPR
jgi:hypothetical protein